MRYMYTLSRAAGVVVWLGSLHCFSLFLSCLLTSAHFFLPVLFPSLWLWDTLSWNGLYFLPFGICAAGNDDGEKKILCKEEKGLIETENSEQDMA